MTGHHSTQQSRKASSTARKQPSQRTEEEQDQEAPKIKVRNGPVLRIYTRTGDKGTSALFSGERRPKSDVVFETLGATDELSCSIGFARELIEELIQERSSTPEAGTEHCMLLSGVALQLERIQCVIQDLQSAVATPLSTARAAQIARTQWCDAHLQDLEDWMDDYQPGLPPLKNFIIPSGGKAAAALHVCRAISRRAERRVVPLLERGDLELGVLKYLNRLSSYLFTVARVAAAAAGQEKEKIYIRPRHASPAQPGSKAVAD